MSTVIYNDSHKELGYAIAHISEKGIVYSDPAKELGLACGHIGDGGRVYNHPASKAGFCLGHVDESGKIYNHPTSKIGNCVGHVDENGIIYNHPEKEMGYAVGHATGPHFKQAAAIYLLMLYNGTVETPSEEKNESQSQTESKPKAESFARSIGNDGCSGFFLFLIVAVVLSVAEGIRKVALSNPTFILLVIRLGLMMLSPFKNKKLNEFNVSPSVRSQCLNDAKSASLLYLITPVILGIYTFLNSPPNDFSDWLLLLLPVTMCWVIAFFCKYMKNLSEAETNGSQKSTGVAKTKRTSAQKAQSAANEKAAKAAAPASQTKAEVKEEVKNEPKKTIIQCTNCHSNIRIPAGKGKVKLKCPKCEAEIIADS